MAKNIHEIRDPIHVFIKLDSYEREVLDSRPFQRLRHIHQLALSHLVYPGATHKRFEHSLGVMELAGRVFDVVTHRSVVTDNVRKYLPETECPDTLAYWRRALRMAALCHDLGHLPFSHTSEALLPDGWSHERMTAEIIRSDEMCPIWDNITPPLRTDHIVKLAIGPKKAARIGIKGFSEWEELLSEIIVGDAFGVDRMDYLLRDSYHAGVTYGKFDHYRLIDTLRFLPRPDENDAVVFGIEDGGLHSSEAMLLARYFMFMQVYYHPVRRIYDIHLRDFLKEWLPEGTFSTKVEDYMCYTDIEVTAALRKAGRDSNAPGHQHAQRIQNREHFKVLYTRNPNDIDKNQDAVSAISEAACGEFGEANVRDDIYTQEGGAPDFPVLQKDERIVSSLAASQTLRNLPVVATGYVFISRKHYDKASKWLNSNREDIIAVEETEEGDA